MFPGIGTLVNVLAVLAGTSIGVLVGHRFTQRIRDVVTDALGLVTLLIAASAAAAIADPDWHAAVGDNAPMLIVLAALLVGGIAGSVCGIEQAMEDFGTWLQSRFAGRAGAPGDHEERQRFVEGFVSSSLVFCVGPLTVLGALSDGLGNGADMLYLKAALDGFASIAFAATLGWGVATSALAILGVQGSLTVIGALLGDILPDAHLAALTTAGGLMLVGVALRLLHVKQVPVGDLLPALLLAPLFTELVVMVR